MSDIAGQRFGMLTALFPVRQHECGAYYWRCKCDCGNENEALVSHLRSGNITKCNSNEHRKGVNIKHGLKNHPLYSVWAGMKRRCYNENSPNYPLYGGRGISVCDRWRNSVKNFYDDMIDGYSKGLHLDRIDVNGNYEPINCRWVTPIQNNNNKRLNWVVSFDGRTHTPTEWGRELGIKANTIQNRKRKGWTDFEALFGLNKD